MPIRIAGRSTVLNPCSVARTVYVPGSTAAKAYSPTSFDTTERLMPVDSFVIVTSTPGTTPARIVHGAAQPTLKALRRAGARETKQHAHHNEGKPKSATSHGTPN